MFSVFREQVSKLLKAVQEREITEKDLSKYADDLRLLLVRNDVALETADDIVRRLKEEVVGRRIRRFSDAKSALVSALRSVIKGILSEVEPVDIMRMLEENKAKGRVSKIVFLGVNGVGKTLAVAKVALLLKNSGFKVVLACADTFRAGAIEQLEKHAAEVGVRMIKRPYGSDPASVAYDAIQHAEARGLDVVLVDTAGRMHTNVNLMEELRKIVRVAEPDLNILVVDALTGHDAVTQSKMFLEGVGFDAVFFTKVDANAKCGGIISVVHQTKRPVIFLGIGTGYEDIKRFDVDEFLREILGDANW